MKQNPNLIIFLPFKIKYKNCFYCYYIVNFQLVPVKGEEVGTAIRKEEIQINLLQFLPKTGFVIQCSQRQPSVQLR